VNSAGTYRFGTIEEVTEEEFHRHFDTNVLGLLLATKAAVVGPEGGSVINIGSAASRLAPPGASIYSATKGAVDVITRVLAKELGPRSVQTLARIGAIGDITQDAHMVRCIRREIQASRHSARRWDSFSRWRRRSCGSLLELMSGEHIVRIGRAKIG
jgi:3-oxoacyl-[acyl-carrier protein] reductase